MRRLWLAFLLLAAPAMAAAEPLQLNCYLSGGRMDGPYVIELLWQVTLDEEARLVTWAVPANRSQRSRQAIFTADEVRWPLLADVTATIDRHNLTLSRTIEGGRRPSYGQCEVASPGGPTPPRQRRVRPVRD